MSKKTKNQSSTKRTFKDLSRNEKIMRVIYLAVLISFAAPIAFIIIRLAAGGVVQQEAGYHSAADYALMLLECVLGLVVIHIPSFLEKRLKFELPVVLYVMYIIFLYCAIFLGEVQSFYYLIPMWDSILHTFSSLMLGSFGFMLVAILNRNERFMVQLSPFFVAMFAFCFGLACGAIWEIYEFTLDGLLGMNMQKYMLSDGTLLTGKEALADTMKDIILDAIGALAASVVGYISLKKKNLWLMPKLSEDTDRQKTQK